MISYFWYMSKQYALVPDLKRTPAHRRRQMQVRTLLIALVTDEIPLILGVQINNIDNRLHMLFILNIIAWSSLLIRTTVPQVQQALPGIGLNHLRLAQTLQVLTVLPNLRSIADILFIVLNIKLMVRLLIVWFILDDTTEHSHSYLMLVFVWSAYECIRYFIENVRNNYTQSLVHNIFAVMDPLELFVSIFIVNQHIESNKQISQGAYYGLRALQAITILYTTINYVNH